MKKLDKKKYGLIAAAMGFMWMGTASAAPAIPDNPGTVRENLERQQAAADVETAVPNDVQADSTASFALTKLTVTTDEAMKYKAEDLAKITARYEGTTVTLADLNKAAAEVTGYFRSHGYPAASAYLPEQKSAEGNITIAVAPGRYGNISIDNQSKVKTAVLERLVKGLKSGGMVEGKSLESALYNIIGLGGVKAGGLLQPGANKGESDLVIKVENGKAETYMLYVNNYGSHPAGRYRYGFTADWYELSGMGDHLGLNGMVSNASQKNFGIRYDTVVGRSGTRLGVGISHGNYELGADFAAFGFKGTATTYSLYGLTPLFHTSKEALYLNYGYDYRDIEDKVDRAGVKWKKHSHAVHVGLNGFKKQAETTFSYGVTGYGGTLKGDSVTGRDGSFSKLTADATMVHKFAPQWDVLVRGSAQVSGSDLDSSEEMYLGGMNGVRAYPQGEGSGDKGFLGTVEVRYHIPRVQGLTLSTYLDGGRVYSEDNPNRRNTTLKGWGIGVAWVRPNDFYARFDYARRIGLGDNTSEYAQAKNRLWFMLGKIW